MIHERCYFYLCWPCKSQHTCGSWMETGPSRGGGRGLAIDVFELSGGRSRTPDTTSQGTRLLVVVKPNRIIRKNTDANCSSFHLRVFLQLSNPQGQRQTNTLSIPRDNFEERKTKFNLETTGATQMQLYRCIHVP
jgi:hypothetical protein